ncbi:MAG TPA: hypothetical protein VFP19_06855 [Candidatus Limnocylindrales bacterium]|nr:hypothetical protein [Candidatus Limnocylindrales bacterium]
MEPSPVRRRYVSVDRIAQELVAEVVLAANAGCLEDAVVDELLERRLDGLDGHVHDAGQDVRHEGAANDRAGAGNTLGIDRQAAEALNGRVLEGLWDSRLANCPSIDQRRRVEGAEQLLDVKRYAVGPLEDGVDDVAGCRQPAARDQRGDRGRLLAGQPWQPRFFSGPLGEQPRAPVAQHGARTDVLRSVRRDQEHAALARATGQIRQDFQAELVGPLEIVEPQHQRRCRGLGETVDDLGCQQTTSRALGLEGLLRERQDILSERTQAIEPRGRATQVEKQRARDLLVLRRQLAGRIPEALALRDPPDGPGEPRLANPRFSGEKQELPARLECLLGSTLRQLEDLVSADQQRREMRACCRQLTTDQGTMSGRRYGPVTRTSAAVSEGRSPVFLTT